MDGYRLTLTLCLQLAHRVCGAMSEWAFSAYENSYNNSNSQFNNKISRIFLFLGKIAIFTVAHIGFLFVFRARNSSWKYPTCIKEKNG